MRPDSSPQRRFLAVRQILRQESLVAVSGVEAEHPFTMNTLPRVAYTSAKKVSPCFHVNLVHASECHIMVFFWTLKVSFTNDTAT